MNTSNFKEVFESPKVKALTAQVAALEAEVMRLRGALETLIAEHEECEDGDGWMAQMCSMEALHVAGEVMFTPFTPTALNELVEKVEKMTIERCVNSCKSESERWNIRLATANRDASELVLRGYSAREDSAYDCSMAIRALPVGQIKLEELL